MQRALILLILLIIAIGLYLFNQKSDTLTDVQSQQSLEPNAQAIEPTVVKAAKEHIEKLTTESKEQVLDITKADNFVTGEQLLKMPTMESETIAIEKVAEPHADQPVQAQVTKPVEQAQTATTNTHSVATEQPEQAQVQQAAAQVVKPQSEAGTAQANVTQPQPTEIVVTQVVDNGSKIIQTETGTAQADANQPLPQPTEIVVTQVVDNGSKIIQGAAAALQNQSVVVTQGAAPAVRFEPAQVEAANVEVSATTNTQSLRPGQRIRLQELLSDPDLAAGTVFYIHAVSPTDAQGLWGILQRGLVKTFAQGIELKQSGRVLTAEIPMLADETLENRRSSFLGEFLYQKVQDTYVYNYQQGMLGQDPDLIKPGQQLIIVSYSEEELISIFNHFTRPGA